jgi:predicted nucleotidyltransferase
VNRLEESLRRIFGDLSDLEHSGALVGGLAVSVRTEPRFTRDVDVAVVVRDDSDAESLIHALQQRGYRTFGLVEQEATSRLAAIRLERPGATGTPAGDVVDLLFASSGIEAEIVSAADVMEVFPDLRLPVASTGHLLALKILSRDDEKRPLDRADILALLETATEDDLVTARNALALIEQRGYARGKSLSKEFEQLAKR